MDSIHPRIFLQISKYLSLRDILQLAQVNKTLRKTVAKSLKPQLRKYFELKSYIEKYPFKCIREALNRKLLVLSNEEVDDLLLYGSRVNPKNVSKNPEDWKKEEKAQYKKIENKQSSTNNKRKGKKKGGKKGKKPTFDPIDEVVNREQEIKQKAKNLRKKLVQVVPGLNINQALMGKRIAVFSDGSTVCVLPLDKIGKLKKIKEVHCSLKLENVVKFQVVSTLVYQKKNGALCFIDTPENDPDTWKNTLITDDIDKNTVWGSGYLKLIIIRKNVAGETPLLSFYENYIEKHSGADHKMELSFRVKNICVAKHLFYLIAENGQVYQGDYVNFNIVQITKDTDYAKQ